MNELKFKLDVKQFVTIAYDTMLVDSEEKFKLVDLMSKKDLDFLSTQLSTQGRNFKLIIKNGHSCGLFIFAEDIQYMLAFAASGYKITIDKIWFESNKESLGFDYVLSSLPPAETWGCLQDNAKVNQ